MLAGVGRIAAALAIAIVSTAAIAQVIPPSAQPGRERERFTQPPVPRAQPGGPPVSLPSTVAPPGADKVKIVIRSVSVVGSTVHSAAQLEPLYADLLGRETTLATVYEIRDASPPSMAPMVMCSRAPLCHRSSLIPKALSFVSRSLKAGLIRLSGQRNFLATDLEACPLARNVV